MNLLVLNEQREAIETIDSYDSLIWVDRYNSCGDFEIYGKADEHILSLLKSNGYISVKESKHSMIVENFDIRYDVESSLIMSITGRSLESILDRRIVWKQTILQGSLQDSIERLLNENIINPEQSNRKIDDFIFRPSEDPLIKSLELNVQLTGDNLLEVIEAVCIVNGIGFRVLLEDTKFVFELYSGVDRSFEQLEKPYVIFSPKYANLISSEYKENTSNYKNVTLVAGQGEGLDRKTVEVGDASGIDRRESFTDARDLSTTYYDENNEQQELTMAEYEEVLRTRGNEKLSESKKETNFESELDNAQNYIYGEDYNMGDIVQVETGYGIESRVRITELIYSISREGYDIHPTFTNLE